MYPETVDFTSEETIYQTDTLDNKAREILEKGGKVLIKAGKKVTYGKEVVQYFYPGILEHFLVQDAPTSYDRHPA